MKAYYLQKMLVYDLFHYLHMNVLQKSCDCPLRESITNECFSLLNYDLGHLYFEQMRNNYNNIQLFMKWEMLTAF